MNGNLPKCRKGVPGFYRQNVLMFEKWVQLMSAHTTRRIKWGRRVQTAVEQKRLQQ
jgi:hypothetical protein